MKGGSSYRMGHAFSLEVKSKPYEWLVTQVKIRLNKNKAFKTINKSVTCENHGMAMIQLQSQFLLFREKVV